jgi:hypothetical protein
MSDTDTDTDILPRVGEGEPPVDSDLPAQLRAAAPRRWRNRATPVLLAVALLAGGFLGGVQVQRHWGKTTTTSATGTSTSAGSRSGAFPGGGASGFPGGGASGGPGGGNFGGGTNGSGTNGSGTNGSGTNGSGTAQATTGTIKSITASALTVTTASGATVTVKIADGTAIGKATTLAQLKAGQSVTVQGSTGTDGSITATAVTAS